MNKRILQAIILIICLIIIAIGYFTLLRSYQQENQKTIQTFSSSKKSRGNGVKITANVFSLDTLRGEVLIRMQFEPLPNLLDNDDLLLNPVTVYTNSISGRAEVTYKKGESMQPLDVTMALDGESNQYPWDRYQGSLWVCAASQIEGSSRASSWEAVPFTLDLKSVVPGFKISVRPIKEKDKGFSVLSLTFNIERARSSLGFAVFIMILIGLLTLVSFLSGFSMVVGGRKIEPTILGWLAAMLFAMLPLRNAMPGAPPVGCLADYLSFFWAEAITAATLIAVVLTRLLRKPD